MVERERDELETVGVAVVTISSESTIEEDEAGAAIVTSFEEADHEVITRELIERTHDNVQAKVSRLVDRDDTDLIVTTGGTGVEPRDATLEAVRPIVQKELPAFLDLFHELSYAEIGTEMVSSRALGGIVDGVPVFCLPNDETATRLACDAIIVPEAPRLSTLANGGTDEDES